MIVYGMNRLPLAQESNEELALTTGAQAALEATSTAVPTHVRAEGSGELTTEDEDDSQVIIKKSLPRASAGVPAPRRLQGVRFRPATAHAVVEIVDGRGRGSGHRAVPAARRFTP